MQGSPMQLPRNLKTISYQFLLIWHVLQLSGLGAFRFDTDNLKAPIYRDPTYDGAAEPSLIYDNSRKIWVMFYTQRRATDMSLTNKSWCFGTSIGIATSKDNGVRWNYAGTSMGLSFGNGGGTFRSPHVIYHDDKTKDKLLNKDGKPKLYHLHVSYMKGSKITKQWSVPRIAHYTSTDLLGNWEFQGFMDGLSKGTDPFVLRLKNDQFLMWYTDLRRKLSNGGINSAISDDLVHWEHSGNILDSRLAPLHSPCVFYWKGFWWLISDPSKGSGLIVFRGSSSEKLDLSSSNSMWQLQDGELLLHWAGARSLDGSDGRQPYGVIVEDKRAVLFYMVHPFRQPSTFVPLSERTVSYRLSVIQSAELDVNRNGQLICKRDIKVDHGVKMQFHRSIAAPKLKQAFASELAQEAQAIADAKEKKILFERKRVQDEKDAYAAFKKKQWEEKQGHFEQMMKQRKKPRRAFDLSSLVTNSPIMHQSQSPGQVHHELVSTSQTTSSQESSPIAIVNEEVGDKTSQKRRGKRAAKRDAKSNALRAALQAESNG